MRKTNAFTKILAIGGTILAWIPVVFPVLFSIVKLFQSGRFLFDYLMPAEFFPVFLAGGLLLLWAAVRAKRLTGLIGISFVAALVLLVGGQALAVGTGLASGAMEPGGWQWALVLGAIILYDLAVIAVGVGGILLIRDLFTNLKIEE
jgi:hypothetical protein